ncbi:MAG: DUF1572 domain-containing protein [Nitrospinota bacterium]|nr:MAG: DUF1572 domain-containing protein [Nitrospinota bacterium]
MRAEEKLGALFIETSRERLGRHTAKLRQCVSLLPEEAVWNRTNKHVNSVGNLVLHLCGNVRQWIISGIGGAEDIRQRPQEFRQDVFLPKEELLTMVDEIVQEADQVLAAFDVRRLGEVRVIQGYRVSCLEAIYSAIEHWSHHVGQIIHITKATLDRDLALTHLTPEGYHPGTTA